ncbi:MAG: hypothetical protein AMXMBFR64_49750 [Myxococcales bacterium]
MQSTQHRAHLTRSEEHDLWVSVAGTSAVLSILCGVSVMVIALATWAAAPSDHPELLLVGAGFSAAFALLHYAGRAAVDWRHPRALLYLYVLTSAVAVASLGLIAGRVALAGSAVTVLLLGAFCLGLPKPQRDNIALSTILLLAHLGGVAFGADWTHETPASVALPFAAAALFVLLGRDQFRAYQLRIAALRDAGHSLRSQKQVETSIRERADGLKAHVERRQRHIDKLQEQLIQNEKLASIGELSSCIAHELNNPLTVAMGFTEEAISTLEEEPERHADTLEALSFVRNAVERMAKIINNLRTFSRRAPSNLQSMMLNEVVETSLLFLKRRFTDAGIEPATELAKDLPLIDGDPSALQQVLINLVGNACDALAESPPEGRTPRVTVTTRLVRDEVELSVSDNGPGIPDKMKAAIFGSFYTTKPAGVGTGLGLAICTEIVRRHRGRIGVADAPTGGARFVVRLPLSQAQEEDGHGHGVLVLDPNPEAASALRAGLERLGGITHSARTAAEAGRILQDQQISLLITELRVSDARPISTFLQSVRSSRPGVRIVIVSDPPSGVRVHEILRVTAADGFYAKPVSPDGVAEMAERYLGFAGRSQADDQAGDEAG